MSNNLPWFKFYGKDFISDPKMSRLNTTKRMMWVYLLCLASNNDGKVEYLDEDYLKRLVGLDPTLDEWVSGDGALKLFVELNMITNDNGEIVIKNYRKRQNLAMTPYERVKKYREGKKTMKRNDNEGTLSKSYKPLQNVIKNEANDNGDNVNDNDRIDIDKNRRDIKETNTKVLVKKYSKITDISEEEFIELANIYGKDNEKILAFVRSKYDDLVNYCESTGKTYKNYLATLRNWVKKGVIDIRKEKKGGMIYVDA